MLNEEPEHKNVENLHYTLMTLFCIETVESNC